MYDLIIIGAGPAGISASLYTKRANLNVLIIYNNKSNLEKAHMIENYYGFPQGISGEELFQNGIKQTTNLGTKVIKEEVISINNHNNIFTIKTNNNTYLSSSLILATGNQKNTPKIKNIEKYEGKGVSYCAICDGFFFRNKNIAILGNGPLALNELNHLQNITDKITLLTNGEEQKIKTSIPVNTKKIKEIIGNDKITGILFEDGSKTNIEGLFIALGEANAYTFAKTLGIATEKDNIKVNKDMSTNIKGLYACGNITGGLLQINKSVYEGAIAGLSVIEYLKKIK